MQLHFRAAVGADSPVTLTLFNPHPVERVAFKAGFLWHHCGGCYLLPSCDQRPGTCRPFFRMLQQVDSQPGISPRVCAAVDQDDRQQHVPGVAQQRLPGGGRDGAGASAAAGNEGGPVRSAARGGVPP